MSDRDLPYPWGPILDRLLAREGGYVNHDHDLGGATCWGITQATLSEYRKRPVTPYEVAALTKAEAAGIYYDTWVRHPSLRLDELARVVPPLVVELVLDSAVLFGRARAAKWLQEALGKLGRPVAVDGHLGPATRQAAAQAPGEGMVRLIVAARVRRHGLRINEDRSQAVFAAGWLSRACWFLEQSA